MCEIGSNNIEIGLNKTFTRYCLLTAYKILAQIPITLHKEKDYDAEGREILKCGFKIGGGIDQDYKKSPQGYTDYVSRFF